MDRHARDIQKSAMNNPVNKHLNTMYVHVVKHVAGVM